MKNLLWNIGSAIFVVIAFFTATCLHAQENSQDEGPELRITKAIMVIEECMKSPDSETMASLIRGSAAVAVFPSVYQGAFFVGAQYGKGIMCAFDDKTCEWSAPAFFTMGGGSLGYQFGAQATDLILVIMNQRGLSSLLKGKITLGGDVSVAAGPVGRKAQAETDVMLKAEIYSYSRSKGIFAGFSLKGAWIAPDKESNSFYYGDAWKPEGILLDQKIKPKGIGLEFVNTLKRFIR